MRRQFTVDDVQVRSADATRKYAQQYFTESRLRNVALLQPDTAFLIFRVANDGTHAYARRTGACIVADGRI
jgi:hypothetical protein